MQSRTDAARKLHSYLVAHAGFRIAAAVVLTAMYVSLVCAQGDAKRGLYISKAAGCLACHTEAKQDAPPYAGGRALKTVFGTFYGPNITPHPENGIGRWTEGDFRRAMRHGERPDGSHYFPAFPYPSFTRMADEDVRDLWAYLRSLPPNGKRNQPHDLGIPYSWRPLVGVWKRLFFTPGAFVSDPKLTPTLNRGRYLVEVLGHCGECHTPRNAFGAMRTERLLAGGRDANNKKIPNLTPARLGSWTDAELTHFLLTGETPDGDSASESMAEVVRNTTSQLTPEDLRAIIAYLRVVPEIAQEASK